MDQIKTFLYHNFIPTNYVHDRQCDNEHDFVEINTLTVLKYAGFVTNFHRNHLLRPLGNRIAFIFIIFTKIAC